MKSESFRLAGWVNVGVAALNAIATYATYALLAGMFGARGGTDVFFFLVSFSLLASSIFTALFSAILIPILVQIRIDEGMAHALDHAGAILLRLLVPLLLVAALCLLQTTELFALVSRFSPEKLAEGATTLRYFAPVLLFTVVAEYLRAIIQSAGQYTLPAMASLLYPAFTIVLTIAFARRSGVEVLAFALCFSRLAQASVFLLYLLRFGFRLRLRFRRKPHVGNVLKATAPYWAANFFTGFAPFYFDFMASGLGSGILTALAYAQRLYTLPLTIVLNPLMDIARTKLSELRSRGEADALRSTYETLARRLVVAFVPLAVFMCFFATDIVRLLFARGAFDEEAVRITSDCLRVLVLAMPLAAFFNLNGRLVEAFRRVGWPSFFGTIGNILSAVATSWLVSRYGFIGVPYSKLAIEALYFFPFGLICVSLALHGVNYRRLLGVTLASMAAAACASAATYAVLAMLPAGSASPAARVVVGAAAFLLVAGGGLQLLLAASRGRRPLSGA